MEKNRFKEYNDDEIVELHAGNRLADAPNTEMMRRLKDSITDFNRQSSKETKKMIDINEEFSKKSEEYNSEIRKYTIALLIFAYLALIVTLANLSITVINLSSASESLIKLAVNVFLFSSITALLLLLLILFIKVKKK